MKFNQYAELRSANDGIIAYGLQRRSSQLLKLVDQTICENNIESLKIVDFGCYDGAMMTKLADHYQHIFSEAVGLDVFPHGIPDDGKQDKIKFVKKDLWQEAPYLLEAGYYNLLVASAFFKHHRTPDYFLTECHRLLQKNGVLIMLDPCPWVVQIGMRLKYFIKKDNPNIWNRKSVTTMLRKAGLQNNFVISQYERYWVAPNRAVYDLGVESWVPDTLIQHLGFHQSMVIRKI